MSIQRILITFIMLIYILIALSLTLHLSKFYLKMNRIGLFISLSLVTVFSTFFYFYTFHYVLSPLIGNMASTVISIVLYLSVTWSVFSIDTYNVKVKNKIKEIDKSLISSNKEISNIQERVRTLNNSFSKNRDEDL